MLPHLSLKRFISIGILCVFFANLWVIPVSAQGIRLPEPGRMVTLSPAMKPVVLKGIKLDPKDLLKFSFFIDQGETTKADLKAEANKLIKYFLASLTTPEEDLWVNLSPYEKDRIVPSAFGQTQMGRDLLAQDYLLKQITASLIYPEGETGKKFWDKVYKQTKAKYGTSNIPVNTFNKVWIVPDKAVIHESGGSAFVLENRLKVMLEEDYLSATKSPHKTNTTTQASQIIREIVIPALETEVNEGANFAQLRQVFYSLILATWYKKKIKQGILNQVYSNRNKIGGVQVSAEDKQKIYNQYIQAFKKGVYNYIKEEADPATGTTTPRKYFSGGVNARKISVKLQSRTMTPKDFAQMGSILQVGGDFNFIQTDLAMNTSGFLTLTDDSRKGIENYLESAPLLANNTSANAIAVVKQIVQNPQTDIVVSIPVAAHQEGGRMQNLLDQYNRQTLGKDKFAVVLYMNYPPGTTASAQKTIQEALDYKRSHPQMQIYIIDHEIPKKEFSMGRIRGIMSQIAMTAGLRLNKDMIYISNDADITSIPSKYLQARLNAFGKNKETVAVMGLNSWVDDRELLNDPKLYAEIQMALFLRREELKRHKPLTDLLSSAFGADFVIKSSALAAINGYSIKDKQEEDALLGERLQKFLDKPNNKLKILTLNDGVLFSARRVIYQRGSTRESRFLITDPARNADVSLRKNEEALQALADNNLPETLHARRSFDSTLNTFLTMHLNDEDPNSLSAALDAMGIKYEWVAPFGNDYPRFTDISTLIKRLQVWHQSKGRKGLVQQALKDLAQMGSVLQVDGDFSSIKSDQALQTLAGLSRAEALQLVNPSHQAALADLFDDKGRKTVGTQMYMGYAAMFPETTKRISDYISTQVEPHSRILSIGEGQGILARQLKLDGFNVSAVDISPKATAIAVKRGVDQVVGDAKRLPSRFKEDEFDLVIFNQSIGTMLLDAPLKEAQRVLRPKGKIIILTYPHDEVGDRKSLSKITHYLYYSPGEIKRGLNNAGFSPATQEEILTDHIPKASKVMERRVLLQIFMAENAIVPERIISDQDIELRGRAINFYADQLKKSSQRPYLYWKSAAFVPWEEIVRDKKAEPFYLDKVPNNDKRYHFNQIDLRKEILGLFLRLSNEEDIFVEEFSEWLLTAHRIVLRGKDNNTPYITPTHRMSWNYKDVRRYAGKFREYDGASPKRLRKILKALKNCLNSNGDEFLENLAFFYRYFMGYDEMQSFLFDYGNNSMAFNFMNALFRLKGYETGVAHGTLDHYREVETLKSRLKDMVKDIKIKPVRDVAMVIDLPKVTRQGGINLNPTQMDFQFQGKGDDSSFKWNGQSFDVAQISGVSFTINTITSVPAANLPAILGLSEASIAN